MRKTINLTVILYLLLYGGNTNAQTTYSRCEIHTVNSRDGRFFLETIPFDNIQQSPYGKTVVYNTDSSRQYEVPRYFEIDSNRWELFLSNDGHTLAYVINWEFTWDTVRYKSIEMFRDGLPFKTFSFKELIDCDNDNEDCPLFYTDAIDTSYWTEGKWTTFYKKDASPFAKQLTEEACYFDNDTLYIYSNKNRLLKLDVSSGHLEKATFASVSEQKIKSIAPLQTATRSFDTPDYYDLPKTTKGQSFQKALAKYLGMAELPEKDKLAHEYKDYTAEISVMVDKAGKATLQSIENYDDLSLEKIKSFIREQVWDVSYIPKEADKWLFSDWVKLMNNDKTIARQERKLELIEQQKIHQKNLVADSIAGRYIPKNIEECFTELNKILKPKDIATMKALSDNDEMGRYHHGLGMWLRNNWGLWGGSRLQTYLRKKGLDHPDSMSSEILRFYWEWLHGQNDAWKEFEAKESEDGK